MKKTNSTDTAILETIYEIFVIIAYIFGFYFYIRRKLKSMNKSIFYIPDNEFLNHTNLNFNILFSINQNQVQLKSFKDWIMGLSRSKINSISSLTKDEQFTIISELANYAIMEPYIPLNDSCKPQIQMSLKCEDYPLAFDGYRNSSSPKPKIAHLIQYGFEADVLEILLSEIYEYIDKFFIVESEVAHYQSIRKPLFWPLISHQKRFEKYLDKIVYFNISSEMIENYSQYLDQEEQESIWRNELIQEKLRFKLFLEWNEKNGKYFKDDDLIGFGDTDEIPSFHNLILMKECQVRGTTDIGIWFTFGQMNKYFISDYPVPQHKETLGDPTYWLLKDAIKNGSPSRNRGKSPYYLLGGIHLSRYGYLPTIILKDLLQTENDGGVLLTIVRNLLERKISMKEINRKIFYEGEFTTEPQKYLDLPTELLNKPPFMIPWIMQCNPLRYPSFLPDYPIDQRIDD